MRKADAARKLPRSARRILNQLRRGGMSEDRAQAYVRAGAGIGAYGVSGLSSVKPKPHRVAR